MRGSWVRIWREHTAYPTAPRRYGRAYIKLELDRRFIAIGYARFLPQGDYTEAISDAPLRIEYHEAREAFERFRPANLFSASANSEVSNFVHYGAGQDGST